MLVIVLMLYVDFNKDMRGLIQISDYLTTFHVAGYLVAHGQASLLYPPAQLFSFAGAPFDRAAHMILPQMPPYLVAEFMYMPLAALVFAPLSRLPINWSLFAWQLISFASLLYGAALTNQPCQDRSLPASSSPPFAPLSDWRPNRGIISALICLTLLPVCLSLWIGQTGLVFGLLPLTLGYFLLMRKRALSAGLAWSLLVFKPQFLVPVFLLFFAETLRKRFRSIVGFMIGLFAIALLNVIIFSPALIFSWLHCLQVSDVVYSSARSGVARHIATSLPRALILMLNSAQQALYKPAIYALSGFIAASAMAIAARIARKQAPDRILRDLALIIGVVITPLIVPHFFFYDYCIFALPGLVIFGNSWTQESPETAAIKSKLRITALAAWIIINVYAGIVLTAHNISQPLIFVALIACLYLRLISIAFNTAFGSDKAPSV